MQTPSHIVVFRFSALGDVAMTVPVLRCLLKQYPGLRITVISQAFCRPLFDDIERLDFYGVDFKAQYKGVWGIRNLSKKIREEIPFDAVADLHNVIRSKLLRFFLRPNKIAVIDKGRKEKASLTRPRDKQLRPLKTGFQRYADVFAALGYPVNLVLEEGIRHTEMTEGVFPFAKQLGEKVVGVAPFAKHAAKLYPLEKMREVATMLAGEGYKILLFGSKQEAAVLEEWSKLSENIFSIAGRCNFKDELGLISQLDLMVSMDSANMHLASLYGVPVVSIWGGTHPFLGFYGWGQPYDYAIQEDLPCRPSSVFGNKPCPQHGAEGCMQGITPEIIVEKVKQVLRS